MEPASVLSLSRSGSNPLLFNKAKKKENYEADKPQMYIPSLLQLNLPSVVHLKLTSDLKAKLEGEHSTSENVFSGNERQKIYTGIKIQKLCSKLND